MAQVSWSWGSPCGTRDRKNQQWHPLRPRSRLGTPWLNRRWSKPNHQSKLGHWRWDFPIALRWAQRFLDLARLWFPPRRSFPQLEGKLEYLLGVQRVGLTLKGSWNSCSLVTRTWRKWTEQMWSHRLLRSNLRRKWYRKSLSVLGS